MPEETSKGAVYCLLNPAMPDLIKIGFVSGGKSDIKRRMKDLYKTGVPYPFQFVFAVMTDDVLKTEKLMHEVFESYRVNKNREFFSIPLIASVEAAMKLTGGEFLEQVDDDSPDDNVSEADIHARDVAQEYLIQKRSNFDFNYVDIGKGEELTFRYDEEITATVIGRKKIRFRDEEYTLSGAAKIVLKEQGKYSQVASGPDHWKYKGEVLSDMRLRKEEESGDIE